ncbi:multidrug effflux MFS transporter [Sulfurimonas sp.]|uniref:multidrug effflux MFS transporter n=1 Tax=Sulfurimonas sp. TaxID=2022749 RepID=UPI0025D1DCFB|nr:multidrug effflux MFS transporter [Sulfurimonas sp.]
MKKTQNHMTLILLLATLSSVTPLAIDMYLPSIPNMAQVFGVQINKIELTVSIFLIFFAIGQLVGGILSDRIGRKKIVLLGMFGFSFSSFTLYFCTSLEVLYIFRATQAFFGAMSAVNASAIVRDLFHGKEAAKIFSSISAIMMIAPMIAPALGSLVISFFSWNYIFLFLGIYSLIIFILMYVKLPITGFKSNIKIREAYKKVLTHKKAMGYILSLSFAFTGMFIFIEKSSFIYMEYFALFFGANVLMMIVLTRVSIKLIQTIQTKTVLKLGIYLQVFSGIALVGFSFEASIYTIFASLVLYIGSLGFIFGNAISLALDSFKNDLGVANSVIGVVQFSIAGSIGFLASLIHTNELTPIFLMMLATSTLALISLRLSK